MSSTTTSSLEKRDSSLPPPAPSIFLRRTPSAIGKANAWGMPIPESGEHQSIANEAHTLLRQYHAPQNWSHALDPILADHAGTLK